MDKKIVGKISQIIGPVIDVAFADEVKLPNIYDALQVKNEQGEVIILECQQDIGENTIRTVAMDSTDGLSRGMEVVSLGKPIAMPASEEIRGRLFNVIGNPIDGLGDVSHDKEYPIHREPPLFEDLTTRQEVLYTGIKVRDAARPWPRRRRAHAGRPDILSMPPRTAARAAPCHTSRI